MPLYHFPALLFILRVSRESMDRKTKNPICYSHGLHHPARATSYLVETHHPLLWSAPGCCIRYLPSSPVYSIYRYLGRNCCCLSAGHLWVRKYVLDVKTCLSWSDERAAIGNHRLYSHRSFNATFGVRVILALMGASASQGSIKVKHMS